MLQQEPTAYDLAYRGKTAAVKILLSENEKLKTQTDSVRIRAASPVCVVRVSFEVISRFLSLQNGRMLIHWAALGGHDDLVRHLLSLDVPVDPADDVRNRYTS